MYTLQTAYYRSTPRNGKWIEGDLRQESIKTLATTHGDVWLFVTYPSLPEPKALYYSDILNLLNQVDGTVTVAQWLESVGNQTLPFTNKSPTFESYYVRYVNAWHAGYEVEPITRIGTVSQQGSKWDKEDLLIWRDDLDPKYLNENALFTVNGLYHFSEYGTEGVHIHNGNRTLRGVNDNQIGVHSFAEVGTLRNIPIVDEMIEPVKVGYPLYRGIYITIPETYDIADRTILLVIGGYLQVLGNTYTRISDRTFRLEIDNLGLLERVYDTWKHLDWESMGLTKYEMNEGLVSVSEFRSDAFLRNYLILSQTFFVTVDCPTFFQELEMVENAGLPGRYYDRTDNPRYPLMGAYGRMVEYSTIEEDGIVVLCGSNNRRHHYDFHHYQWRKRPAVDNGRLPSHPFDESEAYYRKLGTQK